MRLVSVFALLFFLLSGCVSIPDDFKDPGISLKSITPRVSGGIAPEFDIVLRVTNPNRVPLPVKGLTYTLHVKGNKVVDGLANDIPEIPAYGEADVGLLAKADLFGGIALLADLMNSAGEPIDYVFDAEVDIGTLYPMISVQKAGQFALP